MEIVPYGVGGFLAGAKHVVEGVFVVFDKDFVALLNKSGLDILVGTDEGWDGNGKVCNLAAVVAPSDTSASYSFQLKNNGTLFERLQHGAEPPESKPVSLDLPPDPWEFVLTKGQENIDALENLIVMVEIQGKLEW